MDKNMFRSLSEEEKTQFKDYAIKHSYKLIEECIKQNQAFHPVIKETLLNELNNNYKREDK